MNEVHARLSEAELEDFHYPPLPVWGKLAKTRWAVPFLAPVSATI
jgi:hypothetical protein